MSPFDAKTMASRLKQVVSDVSQALARVRRDDGHWVFPLEADVTIPAEYIFLTHYLDEIDSDLEKTLVKDIQRRQNADGGWSLFHDGPFDISATVKAYLALKLAGEDTNTPYMRQARAIILKHGGASQVNVFTRIALAIYGFVPWHAVPAMPVEIILLPTWFPFHLGKISYWSRTVIVPLLILQAFKPRARNPRKVQIDELFDQNPFSLSTGDFITNHKGSWLGALFIGINHVLNVAEKYILKRRPWLWIRRHALRKACNWCQERRNGTDGLGAIFPAMSNFVMVLDVFAVDRDSTEYREGMESIKRLIIRDGDGHVVLQPCMSPVWDTAFAMWALIEAEHSPKSMDISAQWLADLCVRDVVGDWAMKAPGLKGAGWPFQYGNAHYPDLDDTAVVGMVLDRLAPRRYADLLGDVEKWILGMQSSNGGWASFDIDNVASYLNHIPFADHGALLDPPTADVTGRCVGFLAQRNVAVDHPAMVRAQAYLRKEQEEDGSWYGRWGTNYIYGTWSVVSALRAMGVGEKDPAMVRAADWLCARQRDDGSWGEDGRSYWPQHQHGTASYSTPSQTAWALLALMAAGHGHSSSVKRGIQWLLSADRKDERWHEDHYTAVGFPRVFYLRYHGYASFFPLWALARYRRLSTNQETQIYGM